MSTTHEKGPWRTVSLLLTLCVSASVAPGAEIGDGSGCFLELVGTQITDNGDGDGFADTHETLEIGISVEPHCAGGVNGCVAQISTESPAIDCMRNSEIWLLEFPETGPAMTPQERFEIKIGSIDRGSLGLGPDDPLEAILHLNIVCSGTASLLSETITLPLDLNVSDLGQTPIPWGEDFEGEDLGLFSPQNNDEGMPGNDDAEGLLNADGWRCQYTDPDWANSSSYNREEGAICYPGVNLAHANAVFWQIDGLGVPDSPDGGRAKGGTRSMYYGVFLNDPADDFTTPVSTVEAAGTSAPVNLGPGNPRLSFWHQISLADHRMINAADRRSADRGVLQVQLFDEAGIEVSSWMNLQPIQNGYDEQNADNFFNCEFDPVDDGNTEDDFFDPTDPDREFGPSSTCYPEFTWAWMGSTTGAFDVAEVGHATTPPAVGDAPSLGDGTWIESVVDLTEFRGRRVKLRFIVTSIKTDYGLHYVLPPWGYFGEGDDGWWIDDIVIDETLATPAEFSNDNFLLGACTGNGEPCIGQCRLSEAPCSDTAPCDPGEGDCVIPCPPGQVCAGPPPDCGADCAEAQAHVFVEPDGPQNPESVTISGDPSIGQCSLSGRLCSITNPCLLGEGTCVYPDEGVSLNLRAPIDTQTGAEPSWVDVCIDGYLESRLCISGDPDGDGSGLPDADCDDSWDSPYCDACTIGWGSSFIHFVSPEALTTYAMEVRCSSVPECRDGRTLEVAVDCPGGNPNTFGLRAIRALDKATLTWHGPLNVDSLRGSFSSSAEIGDYVEDFRDVGSSVTSVPMVGDPPAGAGYYYLVKADGTVSPFQPDYLCDSVTWRSGGAAEASEPARNAAFGNP
jgi:hypothetical protein